MVILENDKLKVSVSLFGAEIRSIVNKESGKEMMWSGDAKYWNRVSPVLFPFVGRVFGGKYYHKGVEYSMGQHGFLRDQSFSLLSQSSDRIEFSFVSGDSMLSVYPFRHEVRVAYSLVGSKVSVYWTVMNLDNNEMYYSIGAHPAFALNEKDSYGFDLSAKGDVHMITLAEGHIDGSVAYDGHSVEIENNTFESDALIWSGLDSVDLVNRTTGDIIRCEFPGFDYVGLWSNMVDGEMAPFVCIEPWMGITDELGGYKDISEKLSIKSLAVNDKHEYVYSLEFL